MLLSSFSVNAGLRRSFPRWLQSRFIPAARNLTPAGFSLKSASGTTILLHCLSNAHFNETIFLCQERFPKISSYFAASRTGIIFSRILTADLFFQERHVVLAARRVSHITRSLHPLSPVIFFTKIVPVFEKTLFFCHIN